MKLPASFLVVSLVFIAIAFVLWFIASLATIINVGLANAGVGFFIFPGILLVAALFMMVNLPGALKREAALAPETPEADYGPLEFLGNAPAAMVTEAPTMTARPENGVVFNVLVVLAILSTVIPFGMFIYGMFVPGAYRF